MVDEVSNSSGPPSNLPLSLPIRPTVSLRPLAIQTTVTSSNVSTYLSVYLQQIVLTTSTGRSYLKRRSRGKQVYSTHEVSRDHDGTVFH